MDNDVYANISTNIKRLRRAQGTSQAVVAEAARLSLSGYRNIENSKTIPRVRNLESIATALGVPVRQLFEPAAELHNIRFRSRKKLRTRSQILTDVARWLGDYNWLEELLGEQRPFSLAHMPRVSDGGGEDRAIAVARAARQALRLTDYEPVRDICGLLDSAGVKVLPFSVASDGFLGLSVGPSGGGPAVVVNTWERISVERWIFSAAHELGHILLHLDDYHQDTDEENDAHEREADAFAAEFLMPEAVFRREWNEAAGLALIDRVIKVKRIFGVSYKTVLYRLAPNYRGWAANIWVQFRTEYKNKYGSSLVKDDEPAAIRDVAFMTAAPEAYRAREPDHLFASDFQPDRLARLVRIAVETHEISLARGAEILGISLQEMRALSASWVC